MTDNIDIALDNVKKGIDFSVKNYRSFFPEMLKVVVLSAAVIFAIVLLLAGLFYLTVDTMDISGSLANIAILVAVAIILVLLSVFVSEAIQSVIYNIMDRWGKKTPIMEYFKKNFRPMVFYILAMFLINIVLFIPVILLMLLLFGGIVAMGSETSLIVARLMSDFMVRIYQLVVGTAVAFVFQFALFELIVTRKGVIESLKKSYSIVKNTFLPTVVFDIAAWAVEMIVSLVMVIAILVIGVILGLIVFAMVTSAGMSEAVIFPLIAVVILVLVILAILTSAAQLTATLPMKYFYWKKVREMK